MKKKILQICGMDTYLHDFLLPLVDKLEAEGYDVTSSAARDKYSKNLIKKGYQIANVPIERKMFSLQNIKAFFKLIKLMRKEEFDAVHVHNPIASVLGRTAAKIASVPMVIYTAHGFYFHDKMPDYKYYFYLTIEKIMGKYFTDYIFTQSEEDKASAVEENIIAADKVKTIGNGVDTSIFNPQQVSDSKLKKMRAEFKTAEDEQIICFIGRLVREKGILELMEAFEKIIEENDQVKLMIVGDAASDRDQETKKILKELLEKEKFRDKIIMTGYRKDIPALIALSDLFVLPSHREGMPRSIIEAMMMAKPVVATNIRGCREEVVDSRTGYLVPVEAPAELAAKISKILSDAELKESMGQAGRKRALELYDEDKVIERQLEVLDRLLDNQEEEYYSENPA
jgi:glycosyltransferase involved in cell wall biosynthesis